MDSLVRRMWREQAEEPYGLAEAAEPCALVEAVGLCVSPTWDSRQVRQLVLMPVSVLVPV